MLVRSNNDLSAPQITSDIDTFRNLLTKVLVDGYTSFGSLGWTLQYATTYTTVLKSKDIYLVIYEDDVRIGLVGCTDPSIVDYNFPNKHEYHLFPTIYQQPNGMPINKSDLRVSWFVMGTDKYFYFFCGDLLVFFGAWESYQKEDNYAMVASTTFGIINDSTVDHMVTKKVSNLFSPTLVGKKEYQFDDPNIEFTKVSFYDSLLNFQIGHLPNLFIAKPNVVLQEGWMNTTFGKNILIHNFNNRTFLFDTNG